MIFSTDRLLQHSLTGCCIALCLCSSVMAQDKKNERNNRGIRDMKVEIIREKKITLSEVDRSFEKIPPYRADSARNNLTYSFQTIPFKFPTYALSIRPMRLKPEPLSKTYSSFLSVGFGNYITPYAEAWINSKRDEKKTFGANIYHRSSSIGPVDEKNSAAFDSNIKAFASLYGKKITFGAQLEYENTVGYFYGYEEGKQVRRDTIQQVYHVATAGVSLTNTKPGRFNFSMDTDVSYLRDYYSASEVELALTLTSNYKVGKSTLSFLADYFLIKREDATVPGKIRHLAQLKPIFMFSPLQNMLVNAGINAIINEETHTDAFFQVYPNVSVEYDINTAVSAYATVMGDFRKVSLHTLAADNFWVNTNLDIRHTNRSYEFQIGLRAKVAKRVRLEAGFSRVDLKSLAMYRNALIDQSKFDVVYDDVEQLNFFAKASYRKSKKIIINFRGDYFSYKAQKYPKPWHRPTYRIALNSHFNLHKKIVASLNFIGQGGMYAPELESTGLIELDPALDLNLKIDYFISKPFSIFLRLENILSSSYPIYLNYKVRGFQVMGGVSWSF